MKKLFAKDRRNRELVKQLELKHFILKQISTNSNFLRTTRWNALHKLANMSNSKTIISNRCVQTINKKVYKFRFSEHKRSSYGDDKLKDDHFQRR